jgi:hypothetical protein
MVGDCFVANPWRSLRPDEGYGISLQTYLERQGDIRECNLIAGAEGTFSIDDSGRMRGHFVVPSHGSCFQQEDDHATIRPGQFELILGCHTCDMAKFKVTA